MANKTLNAAAVIRFMRCLLVLLRGVTRSSCASHRTGEKRLSRSDPATRGAVRMGFLPPRCGSPLVSHRFSQKGLSQFDVANPVRQSRALHWRREARKCKLHGGNPSLMPPNRVSKTSETSTPGNITELLLAAERGDR